MNRTTETAKENFITDQGSIRLRFSRARRGPRAAAPVTVVRAERTASVTRAAPTAAEPVAAAEPPGRCLPAAGAAAPAPPDPGAPAGRCGLGAVAGLAVPGGVTRPEVEPGGVTRPDVEPGAAPLPLVTSGTVAEPFTTPAGPGRFASDEPSLSAGGSPGGGAIPGARV